jgi:hypothetical protein
MLNNLSAPGFLALMRPINTGGLDSELLNYSSDTVTVWFASICALLLYLKQSQYYEPN